jgi:hypothetical protein
MDDLGPQVAYVALNEGTPVYANGGERVGDVHHVLAAVEEDIFDGLTIETGHGLRFVDAPEVGELHERGVLLKLDAAAVAALPEPGPNPGAIEIDPGEEDESALTEKLRRAWDFISGRY